MDIRQLNALLAVSEHGTFSAAADALHTVQSNVSAHVARLEQELGTSLYDRSAGRLTEEGEAVVRRARRVVAELEAVKADVAAVRNEVIGEARLGLLGTTARWLVPQVLDIMTERYPVAQLHIREGTTTSLEPLLTSGAVDLAIILLPVTSPEIICTPLFQEDMLLVVPSTHALARRGRVDMTALDDMSLLLPPSGTTARAEIDEAAAAARVHVKAKAEIDGVRLTASLVFDGHGPAILPATALPPFLTTQWSTVRVDGLPRRSVGLAHLRRTYPSAPTRALREILLEIFASGSEAHPGLYAPEADK